MEDNRVEDSQKEEMRSEASEETKPASARQQILKYVGVWFAIVAVFFAVNMVIKSAAATRDEAGFQNGAYSAGQPVSNGYAQQNGSFGQCGSGGDCCGGAGEASGSASSGTQSAQADFKQLEEAAIDWYAKNFGDKDVTAEVQDFGCHQQITIKKDGKAVKELSYQGGQFSLLTP